MNKLIGILKYIGRYVEVYDIKYNLKKLSMIIVIKSIGIITSSKQLKRSTGETNSGSGLENRRDAVAREQLKPLIPEHEADVDDSRQAGYKLLSSVASRRPEAIFSRRYFLPIRRRKFIGYRVPSRVTRP